MKKDHRPPLAAFAITLVLVLPGNGISQELKLLPGEVLPKLENVRVTARATFAASGVFTYAYNITNPKRNTGEIWLINIDITKPAGGVDLSGKGITHGSRFLPASSQFALDTVAVPLVPVGLFSPSGWTSAITVRGTAQWGSSDDASMIQAGESLSGFETVSRGLPGIRSISLEAFFRQTPVDEATTENTERIKAIEKAIAVTLATVGPTAPPRDFAPIEFLNYLITLLHDSRQHGWVRSDKEQKELLKILLKAKRRLEANEPAKAAKRIDKFLKEVKEESCRDFHCRKEKALTSEAYALLFFNGQFLLERLPPPSRERDDDDDD